MLNCCQCSRMHSNPNRIPLLNLCFLLRTKRATSSSVRLACYTSNVPKIARRAKFHQLCTFKNVLGELGKQHFQNCSASSLAAKHIKQDHFIKCIGPSTTIYNQPHTSQPGCPHSPFIQVPCSEGGLWSIHGVDVARNSATFLYGIRLCVFIWPSEGCEANSLCPPTT